MKSDHSSELQNESFDSFVNKMIFHITSQFLKHHIKMILF